LCSVQKTAAPNDTQRATTDTFVSLATGAVPCWPVNPDDITAAAGAQDATSQSSIEMAMVGMFVSGMFCARHGSDILSVIITRLRQGKLFHFVAVQPTCKLERLLSREEMRAGFEPGVALCSGRS
jgi:hypothetical protein